MNLLKYPGILIVLFAFKPSYPYLATLTGQDELNFILFFFDETFF